MIRFGAHVARITVATPPMQKKNETSFRALEDLLAQISGHKKSKLTQQFDRFTAYGNRFTVILSPECSGKPESAQILERKTKNSRGTICDPVLLTRKTCENLTDFVLRVLKQATEMAEKANTARWIRVIKRGAESPLGVSPAGKCSMGGRADVFAGFDKYWAKPKSH